jgi:ribosomal protein L7/L12
VAIRILVVGLFCPGISTKSVKNQIEERQRSLIVFGLVILESLFENQFGVAAGAHYLVLAFAGSGNEKSYGKNEPTGLVLHGAKVHLLV